MDFKEKVKRYDELQRHSQMPLPCPRCGLDRMRPGLVNNSLSRHADIYICSTCGVQEARFDIIGRVLSESEWYLSAWNGETTG